MPSRMLLPAALVFMLLAPAAIAQEHGRFQSRSDLVVLQVAVRDSHGAFAEGLPRDAFLVYEDGRPQQIAFFEPADRAVTVGLVIDSSISMHRRRDAVIAAGSSFADACHEDDEMFTLNFNESVWPGLPPGMTFTNDPGELRRALARSGARGQTALFDALAAGLDRLGQGQRQKKVLIVVSDGGDNASRATFEQVLDRALRMDAVFYAVSIHDGYDTDGRPDVLRKLASATGGEAFFLRDARHVDATLRRIAADIRSGYTIGFVPGAATRTDGFHTIRVVARTDDRRKLTVRARSGYVTGAGQ